MEVQELKRVHDAVQGRDDSFWWMSLTLDKEAEKPYRCPSG